MVAEHLSYHVPHWVEGDKFSTYVLAVNNFGVTQGSKLGLRVKLVF